MAAWSGCEGYREDSCGGRGKRNELCLIFY